MQRSSSRLAAKARASAVSCGFTEHSITPTKNVSVEKNSNVEGYQKRGNSKMSLDNQTTPVAAWSKVKRQADDTQCGQGKFQEESGSSMHMKRGLTSTA